MSNQMDEAVGLSKFLLKVKVERDLAHGLRFVGSYAKWLWRSLPT